MKAKDRNGNLWGKGREEVIRWAERQKVVAGCSLEHSYIRFTETYYEIKW